MASTIELAGPENAVEIRDILIQGFPEHLLPYTIYGCTQYTAYLQDQIEVQHIGHNTQFVTYREDDKLLAYAELRSFPDTLFLNNIAVRRDAQGRGIGKRLLAEAINMARAPSHHWFELDVFINNDRAKHWYERLGLHAESEQWWVLLPLHSQARPPTGWWNTLDLGHANRIQKYYEFSQFTLQFDPNWYKIGVISNSIYRITDNKLLFDATALSVLASLDSDRHLLYIGQIPEKSLPEPNTVLASSQHMRGDLNTVLNNLH